MHPLTGISIIVMHRIKHSRNKQHGFTLLEVMIALLVLSIGLLGLAALQTTGLRSNEMASMRTTSTMLAYDISERMRANSRGTIDSDYLIGSGAVTGSVPDCTLADCTTAQMATFDLSQWKAAIALLPGGQGDITRTAGLPLVHTITVRWDENRTGASGVNCPPQDKNDLRCFRLVLSE